MRLFRVALLLSFTSALFFGQTSEPEAQAPPNPEAAVASNLPPAQTAGEIPAERISNAGKQGDWPAIASCPDGSLWAIWIEWNDKDADRVLAKRRDPQGNWGPEIEIGDGNWDHYSPQIVALGTGAMAVWSGQADGNFDLFAAKISETGAVSRPERLTTARFSDFNARAVADRNGNVTIVWQSFRNGNSDIYTRRYSKGAWGPEFRVSDSQANEWEPAVALARNGTAWISWDGYKTGNYDVYLRSFDGRRLGDIIAMTTEPEAQFHTTVAVDSSDRVWVAWDEAGPNWGKDFSASSAAPGSRGLHYSRRLALRVYANGRVQNVAADLYAALTGRMQRYAELPHLTFDRTGTLWLVFRHWTFPKPNEIYHFYATALDGTQWTKPWLLMQSSGQNTQHASLAMEPDGRIIAAYSSDGRSQTVFPTDAQHALHYNAYLARLPLGKAPANVQLTEATLPSAGVPSPTRVRARMSIGGDTYRLLMGDAHRHTDIRGHSGVDGSVLDTYRYALDAAKLDWLGTSDHNEVSGGRWPDGLRDYQWWTTQKTVDLMSHPPVFIGVYSYEHSLGRPSGHRNVLFLKRGGPLRVADRERRPEDNLPPNLWNWMTEHALTQPGQRVIIVPHTFGETRQPIADFNWDNPSFDCLLEIYQGARSSYEAWRMPKGQRRGASQLDQSGHFAQDALARGDRYGFVSFSDHGSTHNSWAAVWVKTEDRAGLFEAMGARRTYAASDEMILQVSADGHMPGEEFITAAAKPPVIQAHIAAPNTVLRIDVIKNGRYIYTVRPDAKTTSLRFQDRDAEPGKAYYYLRIFQTDTENPGGDPEVAWTSPWFVTYK